MKIFRIISVGLVWSAGAVTIIGSSLEEDRPPPPPPVPVTVQFELSADELDRRLGTRRDEISDLLFTASYAANQGDRLTLDRELLRLDELGGFSLNVTPIAGFDELLSGLSEIAISDDFDAGLTGNPDTGRFTSLFDGTTTTVTVTPSGVDVLVEDIANPTTTSYNWPDFESAEHDVDLDLNIRMASAAYNGLMSVMTLARLAEDIVNLVEENRIELEGMPGTALAIPCDDTTASNTAFDLTWTDEPGSGEGEIGTGDEFDVEYSNCQDADFGVYLEGQVDLDNYNPADTLGSGTFAITANLNDLFLANAAIEGPPAQSNDSPKWDGALSQTLTEQVD